MERTGFAFHGDVKRRRRMVAGGGGELRSERADRVRESLVPTVDLRNPWTAFRPSVIALAASLIALSSFSFASSGRSAHTWDTV